MDSPTILVQGRWILLVGVAAFSCFNWLKNQALEQQTLE